MNLRMHILSSGTMISGGKDSATNDFLVNLAKPEDTLLHTTMPGSPFVNVGINPSGKDLVEAAVFCAKYSQDWRDHHGDVFVNRFLRKDMHKDTSMKEGTWNAKHSETIRVKKSSIIAFEEKLLKQQVHAGKP
jgi:predicted ribosome quality control (RQC) complex YloA/Tae2 family protein